MEQVFEGEPKAEIQLEGRRITRGDVANDWGSRLQWKVVKNGAVVATPPARAHKSYEHPDSTPGKYEVTLQLFKYVNYKKDKDGNYSESKYLDVSNTVSYMI